MEIFQMTIEVSNRYARNPKKENVLGPDCLFANI